MVGIAIHVCEAIAVNRNVSKASTATSNGVPHKFKLHVLDKVLTLSDAASGVIEFSFLWPSNYESLQASLSMISLSDV